jgi:hypothetical protein
MTNKAQFVGNPGPYISTAMSRHKSYSDYFNQTKGVNNDHKYCRKVIQEELGFQVTAKKTKKYFWGSVTSNNDVKRLLLRIPKMKGENIACNMTWRFGANGHAVGIFKDKVKGEIYFYDPNEGVYLWENTGIDIYHEIKTHIKARYGQNVWLQTIAMTETTKDIAVNKPHVVV